MEVWKELEILHDVKEKIDTLFGGKIPGKLGVEEYSDKAEKQLAEATNQLIDFVLEISEFITPLSQGHLNTKIPRRKNFLASPFKELHSRLKHLSWQAQEIAKGDYGQRVDFMGDFSEAFNSMVISLAQKEDELIKKIAQLEDTNKQMQREVKERTQIEDVLRESEEYHRGLFENSPTALCLQDFTGVEERVKRFKSEGITDLKSYLRENPQEAFQLSRTVVFSRVNQAAVDLYRADSKSDLLGSLDKVLIQGDLQHFIEQTAAFTNGEDSWEGEARNYNFQKEVIDLIISKGVINRRTNGLSKVLVSINDVTELHQAHQNKDRLEAQLQQAQRMESMGKLAGGIAHDFNNLLMAIQGRTSVMLMKKDSSHPDIEHLRGIEGHVESAADLTKQLLGFARGGKYEVKPTALNELIKKQNRMFGRTRKEVYIREKYEENLWAVEVDRGQMQQVLLNLYINAWQAMPGGGDLYLKTENVTLDENYVKPFSIEPGRYVKISVTDTGVGMDKVTRERIFDPFFTTKGIGKGTGLGLASVYGIIKNHGGFINVYSEKGEGSAFNIYLPVSSAEVTREKEPDKDILNGSEAILLVDDEEMITEVGEELLNALGYRVLTAKGGREAIEVYEKNRDGIDLVILDMIMPDMNGGDTFDRLREINGDINVILSSGYSINGQAQEILDRGCNGFIQKPFNMKQLSQKLREVLDDKQERI